MNKRKKSAVKSRKTRSRTKKSLGRCEPSNLKKYINRKSPAFPAQNCRHHKKIGNDGFPYVSKPDKNGIFKWVKVKEE